MSTFGGLIITNRGRALQAKAQLGAALQFTRMGLGDGELGSSSIVDLTALKHEVKSLTLSRFELLTNGRARIGTVLSNTDIASGFYWRELGIFAQDPDLGEILYCYGNAGALAEYIPAGGGAEVIEKVITVIVLVGQASNISAVLDQSLAWVTQQDFTAHLAEHLRIEIGVAPPENPNSKTFWLEDSGESIDFVSGSGLLIGNASTDGSDDVWFDENV